MTQSRGFRVSMRYIALDTVDKHIGRVQARAALGGHSASEATLRKFMPTAWQTSPKRWTRGLAELIISVSTTTR